MGGAQDWAERQAGVLDHALARDDGRREAAWNNSLGGARRQASGTEGLRRNSRQGKRQAGGSAGGRGGADTANAIIGPKSVLLSDIARDDRGAVIATAARR